MHSRSNQHAIGMRKNPTKSEGILWSVLRGKQVAGIKFRRQHPIGPFIADFASIEYRLVVEIDGEYHDLQHASDLSRQCFLESLGWKVIRFSSEEVEEDAEMVAVAIATAVGLEYRFVSRSREGSGSKALRKAAKISPSPKLRSSASTLPQAGG